MWRKRRATASAVGRRRTVPVLAAAPTSWDGPPTWSSWSPGATCCPTLGSCLCSVRSFGRFERHGRGHRTPDGDQRYVLVAESQLAGATGARHPFSFASVPLYYTAMDTLWKEAARGRQRRAGLARRGSRESAGQRKAGRRERRPSRQHTRLAGHVELRRSRRVCRGTAARRLTNADSWPRVTCRRGVGPGQAGEAAVAGVES